MNKYTPTKTRIMQSIAKRVMAERLARYPNARPCSAASRHSEERIMLFAVADPNYGVLTRHIHAVRRYPARQLAKYRKNDGGLS